MVGGSLLAARQKPYAEKLSAYECGFDAFADARRRFDVRFYLVAILFIIFDLEVAFLFPWAVSLSATGLFGFLSMIGFLGVLTVGFIYEWCKAPWSGSDAAMSATDTVLRPGPAQDAVIKGISGEITDKGFVVAQLDKLVNWARTGSLWP